MGGWIGVDFDGTLAEYYGWNGGNPGKPIPLMLKRVKDWLAQGIEVRIVTARVCRINLEERQWHINAIETWCKEHVGCVLPITNEKDYSMIELWDDRCVQVEPNTGCRVDDKLMRIKKIVEQYATAKHLVTGTYIELGAYEACREAYELCGGVLENE